MQYTKYGGIFNVAV